MLKTIAAVSFATAGGLWFIRKLLDSQEEAQPTCRAILREIDLSDFVGETRHPPNSVRATNVYPRGCYVSAPKSQAEDTKLPKQNDDDSPDHVYHGSLLAEPMVPAAEEKPNRPTTSESVRRQGTKSSTQAKLQYPTASKVPTEKLEADRHMTPKHDVPTKTSTRDHRQDENLDVPSQPKAIVGAAAKQGNLSPQPKFQEPSRSPEPVAATGHDGRKGPTSRTNRRHDNDDDDNLVLEEFGPDWVDLRHSEDIVSRPAWKIIVAPRPGFHDVLSKGAVRERIRKVTSLDIGTDKSFSRDNYHGSTAISIVANSEKAKEVKELVELALKGYHYRQESFRLRRKTLKSKKQCDRNRIIKEISEEARRQAMENLIKFYNFNNKLCSLDLHELMVSEVESVLQRRFEDYCLWLEQTPESKRGAQDWLEIVVGRGIHSEDGVQKLRPEVEDLLQQWKKEKWYKLAEPDTSIEVLNKGCLLVIYSPYRGGERRGMAHFYCDECEKGWISEWAWPSGAKRQKCGGCKNFCKPMKFCEPFRTKHVGTKHVGNNAESREHRASLCERCLALQRRHGEHMRCIDQ
ncbi:uncharacterized protein [Oscarella lobularis]|uniref:uncharacterized protein isoform X2 n=1 Tax=Oscarella lobularis TaxID=121494 RepID=UPI0033133784